MTNSYRTIILSFLLIQIFSFSFAKTFIIKTTNYKFEPSTLTINPGDEVSWVNDSDMQHTTTSGSECNKDNMWDSGILNPGQKFNHTFTSVGNYSYFCTPHCSVGMKGNIDVANKESSIQKENNYVVNELSATLSSNYLYNQNSSSGKKYIVKMTNYKFEPATLNLNPGDTVVWINTTDMTHTSTSGTNCTGDGNWSSGNVEPSKQFSHVFNVKGSFPYYCIPHCVSGMTGVINVGINTEVISADETKKSEKSERTRFPATDIISNQSVTTLPKGYLEFRIYHRFDDLAGSNGNSHNLYGLDNIRDERLGFAYGVSDKLMVGIGRSEGDVFQTPYQEVSEIYDAYFKYRVLKQINEPNGKAPFSLSLFANTAYSRRKRSENIFSEAYFPTFGDRFSYCGQVLLAYNFKSHLSIQIMPTYLKRNWVNENRPAPRDEVNLFSIGGAARWNFTKHFSILGEYFYVFSDYRRNNRQIYSNPLAFGVEFTTGKHVFHINLSNSTGLIPTTFIPYTTSSWRKGEFRLGFTITRLFLIHKKK